ncbi:CNP1-like family protein [Thioalkalicoccus limnaeus]|uniref:CNP1-like family protein n=1 Tax=Thioalkalicoccus limnaeus TaxID=120681 RepID=A0ABV4BDK7_9GAMM
MITPRLLPLLFLLVAAQAAARDDAFVPDAAPAPPASIRETAPSWDEGPVILPPWPAEADLIRFPVDGPDRGFHFAIDGRNLAIGDDGVVRYTLVAESASGVRNVSFEGIRCTPRGQHRIYAYGSGGRFHPVAGSDWQPISATGPDGYRYDLWRTYLCVFRQFVPRSRSAMLSALQRGRVHPMEGTGFLPD